MDDRLEKLIAGVREADNAIKAHELTINYDIVINNIDFYKRIVTQARRCGHRGCPALQPEVLSIVEQNVPPHTSWMDKLTELQESKKLAQRELALELAYA